MRNGWADSIRAEAQTVGLSEHDADGSNVASGHVAGTGKRLGKQAVPRASSKGTCLIELHSLPALIQWCFETIRTLSVAPPPRSPRASACRPPSAPGRSRPGLRRLRVGACRAPAARFSFSRRPAEALQRIGHEPLGEACD